MKEKKTQKTSRLKRLVGRAKELSGEIFGEPYAEWRGHGRLAIGGAQKIGYFSEERIVVLLKKGSFSVCGKRLMCLSFQNELLVIGGRISSVTFEEGCT